MNINFSRNAWSETDLPHAYTYRFPDTNKFVQRDDCIENGKNPSMNDGYDYLSLVTKEKFTAGTKITTRCSFNGNAAPLFVIPDTLDMCEDGHLRYGNYFEVVLYKNGINVWRLWRKEDGTVTWHKRLGAEFPVAENEIHTISVEFRENYLDIELEGMKFHLRAEDMFESFHLGITGCEGLCRFYDLTIDPAE
ncbi:MAG: hypothetical protein E7638_05355 [Ruminococcaceae bacterium]|nr:hypothetical protein [Oscillospiraceae bacterium]